jgi:hypothetical protein
MCRLLKLKLPGKQTVSFDSSLASYSLIVDPQKLVLRLRYSCLVYITSIRVFPFLLYRIHDESNRYQLDFEPVFRYESEQLQ